MTGLDRWIEHWADHRPRHPAVRFEGSTVSYAELHHRVRALAGRLVDTGVGAGDCVVFCGLNRVEQLTALFACARIGAILVPLNNRLAPAEIGYQLTAADPMLALVTDGFGDLLDRSGASTSIVDLDAEPTPDRERRSDDRPPAGGPDRDVLMVYTSGTTGRPRGAIHTQSSLLYTVLNGVAAQDLTATDRVLTVLPLFHVGGLNIQTLPALYVGATVILQRRFDPDEATALTADHRPTQTLLVPAVMSTLLDHRGFADLDLDHLRGLNTGSSVVPPHLIQGFLDRGVPVGQIYGATETGPTALALRYEDGAARIGSCGQAALHTELRIVDEAGRNVGPHEAGELWVRGPHVFHRYWRQPRATAAAFAGGPREGWYRTGDVGRRDGDGYVFIEDRLGDVIVSGGENVYPAEVEAALAEHPGIGAVAVIGRAHDRWGEVPVAVVEALPDREVPSVEALRAWCRERLARFKQPHEVVVVDELPRSALGKVTKHVLREAVGRG